MRNAFFSVPPFLTCSKLITHPRNRLKCRFKYSKIENHFQPKVFKVAVHFLQLILVLKNRNYIPVGIWTPNAQIPNSFEIWLRLLFRFCLNGNSYLMSSTIQILDTEVLFEAFCTFGLDFELCLENQTTIDVTSFSNISYCINCE